MALNESLWPLMTAPKQNKTHGKVQLIKKTWVHWCIKCCFIEDLNVLTQKSAAHCGQLKDPAILICRLILCMSGKYELIDMCHSCEEFFHKLTKQWKAKKLAWGLNTGLISVRIVSPFHLFVWPDSCMWLVLRCRLTCFAGCFFFFFFFVFFFFFFSYNIFLFVIFVCIYRVHLFCVKILIPVF